jgi:PleD family two-component response regulator
VSAEETRKAITALTDAAGIAVAGAGAAVVLQNPTPPTPKPSSKILLAEDNKVNIMVAQSMLKRLGYSFEVVGNGADVIQALKQSTYDLILMVSFFVHLMHSLFSC